MKVFGITEYSEPSTDATSKYTIKLDGLPTVAQVFSQILDDKRSWGYIGIKRSNAPIFGFNALEYANGKLKETNEESLCAFWNNIMNWRVTKMEGSGGWSRNDFLLTITSED